MAYKKISKILTWCKCERCGYEWTSKQEYEDIVACSKCKSNYWKKPRKKKGGVK